MTFKSTICLMFILMFSGPLWAESLVVIVNKENPTSSLSQNEVQQFFLLESKTWPPGGRIKPINRNKNSKPKRVFIQSILEMTPEDYNLYWIRVKQLTGETEPKSVRSNKFVLKLVSKNRNAVGYLPQEYLDKLDTTSKSKIKTVFKVEKSKF